MSFKSKLYNIVIDDKTVGGKRFDIFIMTLIVISLIVATYYLLIPKNIFFSAFSRSREQMAVNSIPSIPFCKAIATGLPIVPNPAIPTFKFFLPFSRDL